MIDDFDPDRLLRPRHPVSQENGDANCNGCVAAWTSVGVEVRAQHKALGDSDLGVKMTAASGYAGILEHESHKPFLDQEVDWPFVTKTQEDFNDNLAKFEARADPSMVSRLEPRVQAANAATDRVLEACVP